MPTTYLRDLTNGAKVAAEYVLPERAGMLSASVVLADRGGARPFVTWLCCDIGLPSEHCINGGYFDTFDEAFENFIERIKKGR